MGSSPHLMSVPGPQFPPSAELGRPKKTLLFTAVGFFKYRLILGCRISSLSIRGQEILCSYSWELSTWQRACSKRDLAFMRGHGCQLLMIFQLGGNRESSTKHDFTCETNNWILLLGSSSSQIQKHPITFFLPLQTPFFLVWIHTCFSASLNTVQETDTSLPHINFQSKYPSTCQISAANRGECPFRWDKPSLFYQRNWGC